jgi:hypothetical protein
MPNLRTQVPQTRTKQGCERSRPAEGRYAACSAVAGDTELARALETGIWFVAVL